MAVICFVTYEIHPTTWGGCGVLLHHAAEILLRQGHRVVFLLDIPKKYFDDFANRDRLAFPNPHNCRAYHADELCADFPLTREQTPTGSQFKALRFAHCTDKLRALEPIDFLEFFEYCGVGYYAFAARLYSADTPPLPATPFAHSTEAPSPAAGDSAPSGAAGGPRHPVLATRLHNSIELIDLFSATRNLDMDRYVLYALERHALLLSETTLTPTRTYFDRYYRDMYALPPERVVVSQSPKLDFPFIPARPPFPPAQFRIVYVGRMFLFKGVEQLVRAGVDLMRLRPELDFQIELIGPDNHESPFSHSLAAYLRTLIPAHLRHRFLFPGHLSHDAIVERLAGALFAVFPNRFESFCYALHEVYDAGIPVLINNLPGFADFFHHERNCLTYDGSTAALVASMQRMIDDHETRERLRRPYPVADAPLGDIYAAPRALRPLVPRPPLPTPSPRPGSAAPAGVPTSESPRSLVVVLSPPAADPGPTISALSAQTDSRFDVVVLHHASPDAEETLWLLGSPWHARDAAGSPLSPSALRTRSTLLILHAGDRPAPHFLARALLALDRRPDMAFAGSWLRDPGVLESPVRTPSIDLCPETYPFEMGAARPRVLFRTDSGLTLPDLFDPDLGHLAEIGAIWAAVARFGPGVLNPSPDLQTVPGGSLPVSPDLSFLKFLVMRYAGPFQERLRVYAPLLHERAALLLAQLNHARQHPPARECSPAFTEPARSDHGPTLDAVSVETKIKLADTLGGRTLVRLALRKLRARVGL